MCNTNRAECGVSREVYRGANKDDGWDEKEGLRKAFSPKIKADPLSLRIAAVAKQGIEKHLDSQDEKKGHRD